MTEAAFLTPEQCLGVIVMNVGAELRQRLKNKPCQVVSADPDLLVFCGHPPHVEHWARRDNRRQLVECASLTDTIALASLDAVLPLAEVYDKVEFDR